MDNKHFIWIVPLIFILGFIVGYVSGLNIPDTVTFGIDKDSREWMSEISNKTVNSKYYITQQICEDDIRNKDNSFLYCFMNFASVNVNKTGMVVVPYEDLDSCLGIVDTMPDLLYD